MGYNLLVYLDGTAVEAFAYPHLLKYSKLKWHQIRNYDEVMWYIYKNGVPEKLATTVKLVNPQGGHQTSEYLRTGVSTYCEEKGIPMPEFIIVPPKPKPKFL